MRPEGFYKITLDGKPGVGHCRHDISVRHEPYEVWSIMYLPREYPAFTTITSRSSDNLVVGDRI